MSEALGHQQKEPTLNRHRFPFMTQQDLVTRLSQFRLRPDTRALLAYGLVVTLSSVAMLIFTGAPFADVPMGI